MGHLGKLTEEYKDKGLTVIALTNQDRSAVDKFVEETGAKHPIVIESSDSMRSYGATGWPTSFLIDPGGRIVMRDTVIPDAKITELLESVKILPTIPKTLKAVEKSLEKEKFGEALKKVSADIEKGKLEGEDKTAAEGIAAWIQWYAESNLEGAAKDSEKGKHYAAWRLYGDVAEWFKGTPEGDRAAKLAKEMLADDAKKDEIKAGDKLAKLKLKIRDMSPKKAIKALQPMTGKKYKDTTAGKEAAALIAQLERAQP